MAPKEEKMTMVGWGPWQSSQSNRQEPKRLSCILLKPSAGSHDTMLLISIPAFTFELGFRANIKGSHHILSLLCPNQPWLSKSCYQNTHSSKNWGQKPAEKNGKTHKGQTASRSNHNWRNPVKSSTRLEHIKQIFSASISRKNISLLAMGLMKVWLEKIKRSYGKTLYFWDIFWLCEEEMQLLTCAGDGSGLERKGNNGWSSEQERDTLTDLCG